MIAYLQLLRINRQIRRELSTRNLSSLLGSALGVAQSQRDHACLPRAAPLEVAKLNHRMLEPERAAWFLRGLARRLPQQLWPSKCLDQALTLQRYFAQFGVRGEIRIGIPEPTEAHDRLPRSALLQVQKFSAHAWLEIDGRAIGESDVSRFRLLQPLDAVSQVACSNSEWI